MEVVVYMTLLGELIFHQLGLLFGDLTILMKKTSLYIKD